MNKKEATELIEKEFIKILAEKIGITGDEEAMKILEEVVFPHRISYGKEDEEK